MVKAQMRKTGKIFDTKTMVTTGMMIALTIVMMTTPLGTIRLPVVSITVAHIPILIAALTMGLYPGIVVGLAFGLSSLFVALTSPASILDPLFVNPLVSVLPRVLIPITTYFSYKGLDRLFGKTKKGNVAAVGISVAIGNLTNTFGVYTMLYLIYAQRILEESGTPAINMIIAAISTTTLWKCIGVVLITTPVVIGLRRALRYSR
ncbi:ECF transporter S component [Ruminococcaceae bacterium OttesenSCG-928-L11]|nr:ECF transporter S component [Ruminococcaceae bacterium OttesenSCG-928-L11]